MSESEASRRILVTGGRGLVGSAVRSAWEECAGFSSDENSTIVYVGSKDADLRCKEQARAIFQKVKPTHVVHLAARVGGLYANLADQLGFLRDNIAMNENVTSLCHEYGVTRAIFCLSTCAFPPHAPLPYTEDSLHLGAPHPSNEGYAHSKRILELLVKYYRQAYGHEWLCIYPCNMYGPEDNFDPEVSHVLPALVLKCYYAKKNKTKFQCLGTGEPLRQFMYSIDVGRLILQLMLIPDFKPLRVHNSVILAPGPEGEQTTGYAAELVKKSFKYDGPLVFEPNASNGIMKKTASNALLTRLFPDYQFISLEEGIGKTVRWFEEQAALPEDKRTLRLGKAVL